MTAKHRKGCIKVVCRFFRGILNRFLGKFQSEFCFSGKIIRYIFRLFDLGFNLFQINESEFSEKTTYNLYTTFTVYRSQGRNAINLKKNFRKFVIGCDIKATKCDKKNIEKSLLEPI